MGSAIECFDDANAVVVPRSRFAPVKTCNDLFALRSGRVVAGGVRGAEGSGARQLQDSQAAYCVAMPVMLTCRVCRMQMRTR